MRELLLRRRALLMAQAAQGGGNLPPGVTAIEYLESTGVQYINTLLTAFPTLNIKTKIMISTVTSQAYFGCRTTASSNQFVYFDATSTQNWRYGSTGAAAGRNLLDGEIVEIRNDAGTIYIDDIQVASIAATVSNNVPFILFGMNTNGALRLASRRIYWFKMYDDTELIRDLVPVLDTNGIACMYDLVTKQFFYNQGTGNFIAGNPI